MVMKEVLYEVRCLKTNEDMILALAGQFLDHIFIRYGNVTHKDVFAEFLHSVPALVSANSSISSAVSNCAIGSSKLLPKVDKD